jgi:hypothetical protein
MAGSKVHVARGWFDESGEHAKRGRLAGAIWSEQRKYFARYQFERDIVHREARSEAPRQV